MSSGYTYHQCRILLRAFSTASLPWPAWGSPRMHIGKLSTGKDVLSSSVVYSPNNRRTLFSFARKDKTLQEEVTQKPPPPKFDRAAPSTPNGQPLLQPNNLFHPFSRSPLAEIRRRAALMRRHAYCPHPSHRQTRLPTNPHDPEARKPKDSGLPPAYVNFECPDCGIPVYCSEEHWADDFESHIEICDLLRQINEDDHDLRSGRSFPEFEYAGPQMEEALVNLSDWDVFLYTREFEAINDERSLRQVTRLLTYPITIGSVLSEFSPYSIRRGGRLTPEGLKSFSGNHFPLAPFSPFTAKS